MLKQRQRDEPDRRLVDIAHANGKVEEHCALQKELVAEFEVQSNAKAMMVENPIENVANVKEGQKDTQAQLRIRELVTVAEVKKWEKEKLVAWLGSFGVLFRHETPTQTM